MGISSPIRLRQARPIGPTPNNPLRRRVHAAWLVPLAGSAALAIYGILLLFEVPLV